MNQSAKISIKEKIGYAFGDAAANLVWRGALAYLSIFYTDTFGISAAAAALLLLLVRLSDGVTDIVMGMIADRTTTKHGKFRPWVLWSAPVLGLFMALTFTTPDLEYVWKLVWAYTTYIILTLAYTANNVPYSALMGVMTSDVKERTSLSGFRFAGAFHGGILVMGFTPDLVKLLGNGNDAIGYQYTMYVFSLALILMMIITYASTKERLLPKANTNQSLKSELSDLSKNLPVIIIPLIALTLFFHYRNFVTAGILIMVLVVMHFLIKAFKKKPIEKMSTSQVDMLDLLSNKPWIVLLTVGFLFMMFNAVKYGVIPYYFKYYLNDELLTGKYFIALLVISVVGALLTGPLSNVFGKRNLFIWSLLLGGVFSAVFFWLPSNNVTLIFTFGCASEFFAAIMPTLFFSMLGDSADYSEWKTGRRATGLIFSAGTFINKTGGGFAGALVLVVLGIYGYNGQDTTTVEGAIPAMKFLMSWIPAVFAVFAAAVMALYPLTQQKMTQITQELNQKRNNELALEKQG
jgi:GPH family glycoside/pentoside/hexuronide:cation symporter